MFFNQFPKQSESVLQKYGGPLQFAHFHIFMCQLDFVDNIVGQVQ